MERFGYRRHSRCEVGFHLLVLLFLQLVFGSLQLLLDLLHVFVHLADGGVQDLPGEESGRARGREREQQVFEVRKISPEFTRGTPVTPGPTRTW